MTALTPPVGLEACVGASKLLHASIDQMAGYGGLALKPRHTAAPLSEQAPSGTLMAQPKSAI